MLYFRRLSCAWRARKSKCSNSLLYQHKIAFLTRFFCHGKGDFRRMEVETSSPLWRHMRVQPKTFVSSLIRSKCCVHFLLRGTRTRVFAYFRHVSWFGTYVTCVALLLLHFFICTRLLRRQCPATGEWDGVCLARGIMRNAESILCGGSSHRQRCIATCNGTHSLPVSLLALARPRSCFFTPPPWFVHRMATLKRQKIS